MNPSDPSIPHTVEHAGRALNGWLMLFINLGILAAALVLFILGAALAPLLIPVAILAGIGGFISLFGHFTIQPNEARVMILFGNYHGTVRESGFHWANPFYSRVRAKIPLTGPQAVPMRNAQTGGISMPYRALGCKISLRGAQLRHREAQGERPARQSHRNRRGHRLARLRHREGRLRRR